MTKKELSINIKWDEFEMGTCRLFVPVLNQYIPMVFFQDHKPKPTVSNKMLAGVNDILSMEEDEFARLEDILDVETYKIKEIHIDQDNDVYEGVHSEVIVSTGSNVQVSIIVKDGKFMFMNDGTYFDTLEVVQKESNDKSISKEDREKIIALMLST
jgi:hypothetical protein